MSKGQEYAHRYPVGDVHLSVLRGSCLQLGCLEAPRPMKIFRVGYIVQRSLLAFRWSSDDEGSGKGRECIREVVVKRAAFCCDRGVYCRQCVGGNLVENDGRIGAAEWLMGPPSKYNIPRLAISDKPLSPSHQQDGFQVASFRSLTATSIPLKFCNCPSIHNTVHKNGIGITTSASECGGLGYFAAERCPKAPGRGTIGDLW